MRRGDSRLDPASGKRLLVISVLILSCAAVPLRADGVGNTDTNTGAFHFAHHISPLLAKLGCSAAECHGGATGQGGFKLSLFADNPRMDYAAIARELGGRRLDLVSPAGSLFLKKPTKDGIKHKGGRILRGDEFAYRELLRWIERGAPFHAGEAEELAGIVLRSTEDGVAVMADFEIGPETVRRDVTHLALLSSSNEQVASIDEDGRIDRVGPGESWIMARYGKHHARLAVRNPFSANPGTATSVDHPLDRAWHRRLRELGLRPAPPAAPEILVRRLYFDFVGRPPSPYELTKFEQLPAAERMERTADVLMESPDFDRVFARHFAGYFEIPEAGKDPKNGGERNRRLRSHFEDAFARKQSVADVTRTVLTNPVGQTAWRHLADPRDRAEYIGRTMLGMRIGCARCHNHPLDRWTNAEHLRFSAYFSDPRPAPGGGMMAGKFFLPESGKAVPPQLLPLENHHPPDKLAPEKTLAWFVLDSGNRQFARNMANRILGTLLGTPMVDLPDDHRITNPAVHEPILDLLADRFVAEETDFRTLVRFIATSQLYAVASSPPDENMVGGDPELRYLARREARPLTPSQFKTAVAFVLGVELKLPAPPESPLAQQLYVLNSGLIQQGLGSSGNHVDAIFDLQPNPSEQLVELYRLILARDPRSGERDAFLPLLKGQDDARQSGKDLAFALLASREFGSLR